MTTLPRLHAVGATLRYDDRIIAADLTLEIPNGSFTVIVGPNACGKSTLLRALSRLIRPAEGAVILDGKDIHSYPAKQAAVRVGILPQSSTAPDGITVAELVSRGRYPHQGFVRRWSVHDERLVARAMADADVTPLSTRRVDELSGGQRQRVWIAMALAQDTPILLLDEPTTFLDIRHQIDLMELLRELNIRGRTLVAVLHDLNQAARYATHLVAMREGRIVAQGAPAQVVTAELVEQVFDLPCVVAADPVAGSPLIIPLGRLSSELPKGPL